MCGGGAGTAVERASEGTAAVARRAVLQGTFSLWRGGSVSSAGSGGSMYGQQLQLQLQGAPCAAASGHRLG